MRKLVVVLALFCVVLAPTAPAQADVAWPSVSQGATGPTVEAIQHLLTAHGYTTAADGQFGSGTASKVRSFQTAKGLTVDGNVGPQTWPYLVISVRSGATGSAVKAAQVLLRKNGYSVTVDGQFGAQTDTAVRSFQSSRGLTVDGLVGPTTWRYLAGTTTGGGSASLPLPRSAAPRNDYAQPHWNSTPAIDLIVPSGTSVYAMLPATTQYIDTATCGTGLRLNLGNNDRIVYCHLTSRSVGNGVSVSAGTLVGRSGNTGTNTPHLHVEIRTGDGLIRCPQRLLLAIYDGTARPAVRSLPTTGCTVG